MDTLHRLLLSDYKNASTPLPRGVICSCVYRKLNPGIVVMKPAKDRA
jgi:hypothetical protein